MPVYDDQTRELAAQLREQCKYDGRPITNDGCVRPEDAAGLLDVSPRTLERWRTDDRVTGKPRLPWRRGNGHCLRYALLDVAAFLLRPEL